MRRDAGGRVSVAGYRGGPGFPGFGEGPVQRGGRRVLPGVLAALDDQLPGDAGDRGALVLQGLGEQQHVVIDDLGPAAVVAFGRTGPLALQGFLADVVAVELGGHGEDGEEHRAHAAGIADPGERSGEAWCSRRYGQPQGSGLRCCA
jgi:hypothetical protein